MTLEPQGADAARVTLRSAQEPASRLRGVVIRLFGRREVAGKLEQSLDRLATRFAGRDDARRDAGA